MYERNEEKYQKQTGQYYKKDYITKELIKSFFIGTIAYALMLVLWAISSMDAFLESINSLEIVRDAVIMLLFYVAFMAVYLFVTYHIAKNRYQTGRARLKEYVTALKTTKKMYDREEKLKI